MTNPEPGRWTTRVVGSAAASGARAQIFALANHDGTKLIVNIEKDNITSPEPLLVEATLQFEGGNVLNAQLTGEVTRPNGSKASIFFVDDGTNGDRMSNDGVYRDLAGYNGEGSY